MRTNLLLATFVVLSACGPSGNTPWDRNHDGLITACEGLNSVACDSTAGCQPAVEACAQDIIAGGQRCTGEEICIPTPQTPPVFACSSLSIAVCAVTPRCEVVGSFDHGGGGAGFAEAPHRPDTTAQLCVDRVPSSCESLSNDVCLSHPGCALEYSTGNGVADISCDPNGNCPGRPIIPSHCVTVPVDVCGARDLNACTVDGQCVLEQGPVCDAICDPNGFCPPCANPSGNLHCVPAPAPDECGSRELSGCDFDGRCTLQTWACTAICEPDGNGGCLPCNTPPVACVPVLVPEPDECGSRDLNVCSIDGRCMVQAWACPAICEPDGNGGCLPCDAPASACVPVPVQSSCEGLDRFSCQAAGCEVIELACDLECRDDGNGGCIPCDAFLCSDGSSGSGGSDEPSPPPQP